MADVSAIMNDFTLSDLPGEMSEPFLIPTNFY